jgi:hypothetical protein
MFCDYGFDFPDTVQVQVLCLRIRFSRYRYTVHHSSSVTFYSTVKKSSFLTDPNGKMVLYYHSVFLVPCVPFRGCVPFSSFLVPSLWYVPFIRVYCSLCLVSGLSLFSVPSEYLQIFLGISDTGILPDTVVIYHHDMSPSLVSYVHTTLLRSMPP